MKCPCENCLVKAVCRHKIIEQLLIACDSLKKYIQFKGDDIYVRTSCNFRLLKEVEIQLKPTKWRTK